MSGTAVAGGNSILSVSRLTKFFPVHGGLLRRVVGQVQAVTDVTFSVNAGETLGIVGESGCGKSTLGRTIVRLYEPTSGAIHFDGQDFTSLGKQALKLARRNVQMIFQDPYASLNPRMPVREILGEPFKLHHMGTSKERNEKVAALLETVGMRPEAMYRYPHEFSGGQQQRLGIARAIALNPKLVICDEAVSALDVSIQSQILNLLVDLQQRLGLTFIFISHDLSVVKFISDRVAVMYLGKIVELADRDLIYEKPAHPYTRALLASVPVPNPRKRRASVPLEGDVPSPANPPAGCRFHTRCPFVQDICRSRQPELEAVPDSPLHFAACHFAGNI